MAQWGVSIDDVKDELVILQDATASGDWDDVRTLKALERAFKDVKSALYSIWYEDYAAWTSADLAPDSVQSFIVLQAAWIIVRRMRAEEHLDELYKPLEDDKKKDVKKIKNGILSGSEYVNDKSLDILKGIVSSNAWIKEKNVNG